MSDKVRKTIPHLRLIMGGTLGSPANEIWACGIKLVGQTNPSVGGALQPTDDQGNVLPVALANAASEVAAIVDVGGAGGPNLADACNGQMKAACINLASKMMRGDAALTYVKLNAFGADDEQVNQQTVEAQFPAQGGLGGGYGATENPYSVALVAELRTTFRSRGRGSHARFLYPAAMAMNTAGHVASIGDPGGGNNMGPVSDESALLAFLKAIQLPGTGANLAFVPSIVYTQLPEHVYKTAATRGATFNPIDKAFWSDLPGHVKRRQNKLKQGQNPSPVVFA